MGSSSIIRIFPIFSSIAARQRDLEFGAFAELALDRNFSADQLGEPQHDRKPEPGATRSSCSRALCLAKWLENEAQLLVHDPDTRVAHTDLHAVAADARSERDRALVRELEGVAQQVRQ